MIKYCFLALCLLSLIQFQARAKKHRLSAEKNPSIQAAIDKAAAHDSLQLSGAFSESEIIVKKPITIYSTDSASITAVEGEEIMTIVSDSVTIIGLTFKNVEPSYLKDRAALRLRESRDIVVKNNYFVNTFFGVYLQGASDCRIISNTFHGKAKKEVSAGNAIHVWKAERIEIVDNYASNHRDGIYFEFVNQSYIAGNTSINNIRYGLHFMFSNYDIYENNHFENNGTGVAVMFSKQIKMLNNTFEKNWGGSAYGILLKEISDGIMKHNTFTKNTIGVLAEGANRIKVDSNRFIDNGKAFDIKGNCLDNEILNNNFIGNTFEVLTNSRSNLNHFEGNYWGQYQGYDLNRDGIGDIPHRPVNLFALITDKIPAANMLLNSILVRSLDMAERMFPQLIPEQLIDEKPKMKPLDL